MLMKTLPYFDAESGLNGINGGNPTETPSNDETPLNQESAQNNADEQKTGDIKSEAQKLADGMFAKRMKGISKEEVEAYKANKDDFLEYMNSKKTEAERVAEATKNAERLSSEAKAKEAKANAMILAVKAGIRPEHIEDAVILATAKVSDEVSIDEAIATIADSNPAWKAGANLGNKGGNPPDDQEKNTEIKTFI